MLQPLYKYVPWFLRRYIKNILGLPDVWNTLYQLKQRGFYPEIILDVGAFNGNWTKDCRKIFNNSQYYLIEPQDRLKSELERMENQKIIYKNLLLGRQDDAIVDFYISGTSSSILKFDSSTPVKRKTTSMDTLCKNINISKIDLLKLDVQGYELEILKGAKNVLKRTSLIITEVSLIDVYENCPLVSEIVKYLDTRDFQLFDIADFRRRELDNSLWQCDMFFIRKDNHILFDKRKDKKHQRPK